MNKVIENPFWVQTPESIPPAEAQHLFVNIFTEFEQVESTGHSFITGPRGSGKSMMFRMMRPDCLMLRHNCSLKDLPYLGVYIPIKCPRITATEMARLEEHPGRHVFNEHLLCLYVIIATLQELGRTTINISLKKTNVLQEWLNDIFIKRLNYCGISAEDAAKFKKAELSSPSELFAGLAEMMDSIYWSLADSILRGLAFQPERLSSYTGPLLSYHGFLYPILASFRSFPFFPSQPIYLLIDDADNLNLAQTEVVNSWIATRTTDGVCIKLSDQMGYKTRLTYGGKRIQSPHDYNEVDISVLYTTHRDRYLERIEEIVQKRLALANIQVPALQIRSHKLCGLSICNY